MDFSSVERSLQSLSRRQPALDNETVEISKKLLDICSCSNENENENNAVVVVNSLVSLLTSSSNNNTRWEPLAVGLFVSTSVLEEYNSKEGEQQNNKTAAATAAVYVEGPRVPQVIMQDGNSNEVTTTTPTPTASPLASCLISSQQDTTTLLASTLLATCSRNLTHSEPRVRSLVSKAVGVYLKFALLNQDDSLLLEPAFLLHASILSSLQEHIDSGRDVATNNNYSKSSTGALDDTTGWRSLETNWQCLSSYICSMGGCYYEHHGMMQDESSQLLSMLLYSSTSHLNRHVRAAGIACLQQLIVSASMDDNETFTTLLQPSTPLWKTTVEVLKVTLADNWSQVRMAASVLCREFWQICMSHEQNLPPDYRSTSLYPPLLPRMCLNRFYLAQGVKLYSHDTWKMVFYNKPNSGIEAVSLNAAPICRYYTKMCDADNHVVREAACQAVAELATKLHGSEYLAPHVPLLLQSLLMCFHDESWPVRDEAALACGKFCKAFPTESKPELPTLMERWTTQLTDQIWSVRQDAAVALGDAVDAYGNEVLDELMKLLRDKIPSAKEQPAMTMEEYKKRHNDMEVHTDSQLYSCGSLAPKLRKGGAGRIGCSSCDITRPKSPWEATDGCIYLLQELMAHCADSIDDDVWLGLVEALVDACRVKHFPQGDDLRATLWRQLPFMAQSLGKQRFKRVYLGLFLDLLMSNIESRTASALSKHAAGQCAEELSQFVGVSIFRGRLDEYQQEAFDRAMQERKQMHKGPTGGGVDGFSPFGPPGLLQGGGGGGMSSPTSSMQASTAFPPQTTSTAVPGSGFEDSL